MNRIVRGDGCLVKLQPFASGGTEDKLRAVESHFADRLIRSIKEKNAPVCIGLDPLLKRLPSELVSRGTMTAGQSGGGYGREAHDEQAQAIVRFGKEVIRAVAPHVPAVKINIAFFEPYFAPGLEAYRELIVSAHRAGLLVIGDVKRGDIGHSAAQYARAHLPPTPAGSPKGPGEADSDAPDAITVNPYFGADGIEPFVDAARTTGRGLFILVQTSNDSATQVQDVRLSNGNTLCEHVADLVHSWAARDQLMGGSGYSCVGAVVSPRDLALTSRIRARMPNCIFLVPGFGAQGRTSQEVAMCFRPDGTGAIVNASRSVIYAYQEDRYRRQFQDDWRRCIEQGCLDFIEDIRRVISNSL